MISSNQTVVVTGSSGYVASHLIPLLKNFFSVCGLDLKQSINTDMEIDIAEFDPSSRSSLLTSSLTIVNLAAARFDFGASPSYYYQSNVIQHQNFLKALEGLKIERFIHISSVAALDGSRIAFSDKLGCDDAYRATKCLQERLIRKWCRKNKVKLVVLYPSAIFSSENRADTNIGKMQIISKLLPIMPIIDVKKSVTYLPSFCQFISCSIDKSFSPGNYLTIEKPILTVTEMYQLMSSSRVLLFKFLFLRQILLGVSYLLYFAGGCGKYDLKLTPNRVKKLFSETTYEREMTTQLNHEKYSQYNDNDLRSLLRNL